MKPVVLLALAIACEIVATSSLKASAGLTKPWFALTALVGYVIAFSALARCLHALPVGVVYAVWSGVGTAAVALIGATCFDERLDATRLTGIALIVTGVLVLNGSLREHAPATGPDPQPAAVAAPATSAASG